VRIREVKEMAKFLSVWHMNPSAPWPIDPAEAANLNEMMFATVDNLLREGKMLEFGFFPDGKSGYVLSDGETKDVFSGAMSFYPFVESEVYEMIPYETGKEIMRGLLKAQAEAMAAMKR
jgi:hypothetical protein